MAIYVTGDTHGIHPYGLGSVDGFMHRLSTTVFPEQKQMTKEDYVIILGDFGGVWYTDRHSSQESSEERYALDWLESKPFTTLFVPGNHENYDRLMGCYDERLLSSWFFSAMPEVEKEKLRHGYPRKPWHGGYVRQIRPSVLMLERGDIFEIDAQYCFAFGGAQSHDISDGILDPTTFPDETRFKKEYQRRRGELVRVRGLSWWAEELPSAEEMAHGRETIQTFLSNHERIDFVFTHDAPASDKVLFGYEAEDPLTLYLEELRHWMRYGKWFYGHLHQNRRLSDTQFLLYEQIVRIH
ncbi:MAG: metallophosphoesterase [Clostridia bacterium]|nr:metallophosphoesterase [Clostridia bacterium]MBR1684274.1 metallophosphoesterase [Clostridia bacterium]